VRKRQKRPVGGNGKHSAVAYAGDFMESEPITLQLARAAHQAGRSGEAEAHYRELLLDEPENADLWNDLGSLLDEARREPEAMACFREAMRLRPDFAEPHNNLGLSLDRQGDEAGAIEEWREALNLRPGWLEPRYYLSTAGAHAAPTSAPARYVAKLFDQYAADFDRHLNALDYCAPQLLWEAVGRAGLLRFGEVIDLGCGTGLCGEKFKPISDRIIGVDLAPRMIAKAGERNIYDELIAGDLLEVLQRRGVVDLILAADVFGYVGELKPVFDSARAALRPGGLMAFSVEKLDENEGADMVLRETRRFAHSLKYVERVAADAGLELVEQSEAVLRMDGRMPIVGMIVVVRRK
jgi:predicted TPR repeat methyltransferase